MWSTTVVVPTNRTPITAAGSRAGKRRGASTGGVRRRPGTARLVALAAAVTMIASGCGSGTDGGEGDGDSGFRISDPVNPRSPDWGTDDSDSTSFPRVGATCTMSPDVDAERYCGHLGRRRGSITLTNTGDTTVAVLSYPVGDTRYIVGRWVAPPGASGCFSTADGRQSGFGISIERQAGVGTAQIRVAAIDSSISCGNNGLNMVFEPYRENEPQWESTDNPGRGYTCYSSDIPPNGPDIYCGQLNSDNFGVETGFIVLENTSAWPVRIVSYWQPLHSSIGSYVLGPGEQGCWDFRGNKALHEQHHITLQRPYGAGGVEVRVRQIQSGGTFGVCGSNGLAMDGNG
ncbi:MAG: hypothetical protein SF182_25850 [Deltaproteobacteria bacterium]|nr:hypothetical protein [Deltaproteobacteria bacterium]